MSDSQPIWARLLRVLDPYPQGLSPCECRQLLSPCPTYTGVLSALLALCQRGSVRRVAPGRYAITAAFRTAYAARELHAAKEQSHAGGV